MTTRTLVGTLRTSAALVIASTALPGCSSKVVSENDGGTGGAQSTTQNLFTCGLTVDCPEMKVHLAYWESTGNECAGWVVNSGQPGVLLERLTPGPVVDETQSLIILRGDGTAVLQNRERHCDADAPPCPTPWYTLPWETPTVQQQCNVVIPSDVPITCPPDYFGPCGWWPWGNLTNCTPIDPELSCNNAQAILTQ